jgi:hypothetical protein
VRLTRDSRKSKSIPLRKTLERARIAMCAVPFMLLKIRKPRVRQSSWQSADSFVVDTACIHRGLATTCRSHRRGAATSPNAKPISRPKSQSRCDCYFHLSSNYEPASGRKPILNLLGKKNSAPLVCVQIAWLAQCLQGIA